MKPRDCIYCRARANAGEHTFVAGLGGRRTNRGILCKACDRGFSSLDRVLIDQLAAIRGLLGVRPDHRDEPLPTLCDTDEGPLSIDANGRASWPVARVRSDVEEGGQRRIVVEARDEQQLSAWNTEQQKNGLDVTKMGRVVSERLLDKSARLQGSFGGDEAFREIARIVLNMLATDDPLAARLPALARVKEWILGKRPLDADESAYVWHGDGSVQLPSCTFPFGHRILLRCNASTGCIDAVVSFFDGVTYHVSFGDVGATTDACVLFDIDPLADSPPHDLQVHRLKSDPLPTILERPPTSGVTEKQSANVRAQFESLMRRIDMRQKELALRPIQESINAACLLSYDERVLAVSEALHHCRGRLLKLARYAGEQMAANAELPDEMMIAEAYAALIQSDASSPDGLSKTARVALELAMSELAHAISGELVNGPLSLGRTILLLAGTPGAVIVQRAILEPLLEAYDAAQLAGSP